MKAMRNKVAMEKEKCKVLIISYGKKGSILISYTFKIDWEKNKTKNNKGKIRK